MEQTVELTTDDWPAKTSVALPSPVISVDSIKGVYIDTTTFVETETVLDTADYKLWDKVEPTVLFGDFDTTTYDYYKIVATVGYASADDVPAGIKDILFALVTARYVDRINFGKLDIRQMAVNYRYSYVA